MPSPRPWLTNPPGHLWRDKWTALSGPLSLTLSAARRRSRSMPSTLRATRARTMKGSYSTVWHPQP